MTTPACETCLRIRWFIGAAAFIVIGIYLQPQWAMSLAKAMPDPMLIGLGLTFAGVTGLAVRLHRYRRAAREAPETTQDA